LKSIRLLPVVIFAALALLVFKGIGLVTNGGYVLSGPIVVQAADEHGSEGGLPAEAVLVDTSPTLGDVAPTLVTHVEASSAADLHETPSDEGHDESVSEADAACTTKPADAGAADAHEDLTDRIGNALANGCPPEPIAVNEHGDAMPTIKDGTGRLVPLQTAAGQDSQEALVGRLGDRRAELDRREADLDMRVALVEAAEKRLDEKTSHLAALEARVAALVDEKQATEEAGFRAVVSMYEAMKPKDAAKIFDALDLPVLLKVVRAMSPRKMSPILAAMKAGPAEALTVALASTESMATVAAVGENLAALPQIIGQ